MPIVSALLLLLVVADVAAFSVIGSPSLKSTTSKTTRSFPLSAEASESSSESSESDSTSEEAERPKLDSFLEKKYPSFYKLINDDMTKAIKQGSVTIFVPNEAAFQGLGDKKTSQIEDPRNLEIREKMGSYHIIAEESIDAMTLRTEDWSKGKPADGSRPNTMIAGFKTLSGEVPVGRSKSGGFLGFGGKEDGTIRNEMGLYLRFRDLFMECIRVGSFIFCLTFVSLFFYFYFIILRLTLL